ncbi:MAG: M20/M25/M40 family metallo-hydrolase [Acidobacteriia bacterium]|nr:M20/M25/M40 family metallo-hydrolase [Terriglobia bacterium]
MHDFLSAARARHEEMLGFTRELIAIPTENPPGNCYGAAVQAIVARLRALGFEAQIAGDCVLSFIGSGERTVYFSGHYDVVPAQSREQFEPAVKGANLFGRGSSDMKSGLAAMTCAAAMLRDSGALSNGRIGLVFVPDEETAGPRGSRFLEAEGLLGRNAIAMLTPEPTGGVVWNANRGAITLRVALRGKIAHVGRQREGVNAFEKMLAVADAVRELKKEVEERATAYRIAPEPLRRSILMMGGQCGSGSGFNAVPQECWFTIDRRINPEENFETEKRRLLEELGGCDVEILQEGAAAGTEEDCSAGRALAGAMRRVTGRDASFEMCPGLLETRFYAARGIPAFAYGPGLLTVSHGPNEFVPVERIAECAAIYAETAAELLG